MCKDLILKNFQCTNLLMFTNVFILCQVFAFFTVIISMNTYFENIKNKGDHFQSKYSIWLYKMQILDTKSINSFAKSVSVDDSDYKGLIIVTSGLPDKMLS